jgi:hypothetical protein
MPAALFLPDADGAALGCTDLTPAATGYFAFQSAALAPEYALGQLTLPSPWAAADIALRFSSSATSGSVVWIIQTACSANGFAIAPLSSGSPLSSAVFGPEFTVSASLNPTAGQGANTSTVVSIANSSSNSCLPGSTLLYRVTRSPTDSVAGDVYLVGVAITLRSS